MPKKTPQPKKLHKNNPHQGRYDFALLSACTPALKQYTKQNPKGEATIDFSNPNAVITLNQALLAHYYGVKLWDIPTGYLCPPIPGRADYIHHIATLLAQTHGELPTGKKIHALDIGTGANCIYPIIGSQSYGWQFTATDIDIVSVNSAKTICQANKNLTPYINIVQQKNPKHIFHGIITTQHYFDITLCNPPFHASLADAIQANTTKQKKLYRNSVKQKTQHNPRAKKHNATHHAKHIQPNLNYGGQKAELWCTGGEIAFLLRMATESKDYASQVGWFTSLVSKSKNVMPLEKALRKLGVKHIQVIPMYHGQKTTRVVAWHY